MPAQATYFDGDYRMPVALIGRHWPSGCLVLREVGRLWPGVFLAHIDQVVIPIAPRKVDVTHRFFTDPKRTA